MAQSNDKQARDLGQQLGKKLEEYVLKSDSFEGVPPGSPPLDHREVILGAADYLAYLANRIRTTGPGDTRHGEPEDN